MSRDVSEIFIMLFHSPSKALLDVWCDTLAVEESFMREFRVADDFNQSRGHLDLEKHIICQRDVSEKSKEPGTGRHPPPSQKQEQSSDLAGILQ